MAIHQEKCPPLLVAVLFLAVAFLLVYPLWKIGLRDLFWDEGEYAAIIAEMQSFPPDCSAHGELIFGYYPLYPLLVKGLVMMGLSMEFSLRFISVAALAGLTVMVGIIGFRMAGIQAGAAAAAIMFTNLIAAEKSIEGFPNTLLVLLCFSGWILWFFLGQFGGSWNLGWLSAGLFAGLSFYCGGWSALFCFLVPMMFLKRPFTPWRRLSGLGFPAGVAILLSFILLWIIPRWTAGFAWIPQFENMTLLEYVIHLFEMTWDLAFRLLPWTFFLYAPFCAALIVLDKNPLFSKYLRTLFVVTAVILIFNPLSRARDILYVIPVFSLLAGLNYEIVVRRHGNVMCRILQWGAAAAFLVSAGTFFLKLLPAEIFQRIPVINRAIFDSGLLVWPGLLENAAGILLAGTAYFLASKKSNIWLTTVLVFTAGILCFNTIIMPRKYIEHSRSNIGYAFRRALGRSCRNDMTVYKDSAISGLYTECHYLGTRIRTIQFSDTGELKDKELYLLSPSSIQPPDSSRTWSRIMDVVYKKQNLYMWKGILNDRNDGPENDIRNMRF